MAESIRSHEPILAKRRRDSAQHTVMSGKEKFHGLGRGATAGQKRNQQLQSWEKSTTNKEPAHVSSSRLQPRVRFAESVVFLAACQSGDVEEVERLLSEEKADINSVNKDGLTALHQVGLPSLRLC